MGAQWSAPSGKAEVPSGLLPFTVWTRQDLLMMRKRHTVSLGGIFALKQEHFARLLGVNRGTADALFDSIFDTDCNGLIDAFETMCAMALLCSAQLAEKVDFVHSLFDFGCQGDLSLAEVTILVRTALLACHKLDSRVEVPQMDGLEETGRIMFKQAGIDYDNDVPRHVFDSFAFRDPQITAFLQLWSGSLSQALIAEGTEWEDPEFPAEDSSIYRRPGIVPPGLPPSGVVQWLRPSGFARGDQVVLFVGDVPGDSSMMPAGQLADQWLLSAMGILTGRPHLLRSLFLPTGQEDLGRYCVRIFKEADWENVFVDTRAPCDSTGNVLFCRGGERHELWVLLLEKAFAKAHGCYENITHGDTCEALQDLTGGVAEKLQWSMTIPKESTSSKPEKASRATGGNAEGGGKGGRQQRMRPRLAGWGLPAGSTRPSEWVFDDLVGRLAAGHIIGCSRQVWLRDPWERDDGEERKEDHSKIREAEYVEKRRRAPSNGSTFPPSNRIMRGLRSGVSYCVLEAFEKGDTRLLRIKDPWTPSQSLSAEQDIGEYSGDWGPSSAMWSAHPKLAAELLPRASPKTFWMEQNAFLEVFNTLYAVDVLDGGGEAQDQHQLAILKQISKAKEKDRRKEAEKGFERREGRVEGSWDGEGCGGRFTGGKGWLQGTQAFLSIDPDRVAVLGSTRTTTRKASGEPKADGEDVEDNARVSITVTQQDSRYHDRDYVQRRERHQTVGFLVHTHQWSLESKRCIPKLTKIVQKETKYISRPFLPRRDVSCRISIPPGQYVIVPTSFEPGIPGRFWVHVKADRNFTLQPSIPGAAITSSSAGSCDFKLEERGLTAELAYNEAEEDAEGKGRMAIAARLGALWVSAQGLAAQSAVLEHKLNGDSEPVTTSEATTFPSHDDDREVDEADGVHPSSDSRAVTSSSGINIICDDSGHGIGFGKDVAGGAVAADDLARDGNAEGV